MNDLTPKQINDLGKLAELIDGGEVAVLKEINDLSDRIDGATEIASNALKIASETSKVEVQGIRGDKGERGEKGDKGDRGIDGRNGVDGKNGKDGRDGRDGRDGADGINGKDGKDGEIKDLSPQEIRDSLELLSDDERLDAKYVKGIKNHDPEIATLQNRTQLLVQLNGGIDRRVSTLESNPVSSGSGWTVSTPSGSLYDQVTETGGTSFTSVGTAQIVWADAGTYFNGAGCTISGTSITMDNPVTQWIRVGV